MTATDELRSLLDIHGLRWSNYGERETRWYGTLDGIEWSEWTAVEYGPYLRVTCGDCGELLSPAEVVAVSIAYSSICTDSERTTTVDETECIDACCYSDPHGGEFYHIHVMECSECGHTYEHVNGDYEFCPHCGRRIRNGGAY